MSLDIASLLSTVQTHASETGRFDQILLHEPKSAPGAGITLCMWLDRILPVQSSGLASVSMVAVINMRLYTSFLQEPQDAIDSGLWAAMDAVVASYATDFTLDGQARNVDLFGETGHQFDAVFGYLNQDGTVFRVVELTVPVIVNDCYTEGP